MEDRAEYSFYYGCASKPRFICERYLMALIFKGVNILTPCTDAIIQAACKFNIGAKDVAAPPHQSFNNF